MQRPKASALRKHRRAAIAALTCIPALLIGCTGRDSGNPPLAASNPLAPTAVSTASMALTDAEIQYGVSPTRNHQVTYQDNVIVMERGAEAIRSLSSNGLTWTIDASAPGAREIQFDKILFATGRVVGRVLAVERTGDNLAVTLGPAALTDIIKEAHVAYEGPIDLDKMVVYTAPPDYPGTSIDLDAAAAAAAGAMHRQDMPSMQIAARPPRAEFAARQGMQSTAGNSPLSAWADGRRVHVRLPYAAQQSAGIGQCSARASAALADFQIGVMHFTPDMHDGLGVRYKYDTEGIKFVAEAKLILKNPYLRFNLDIADSRVKNANVELGGVGGMQVSFEGGTSGEFKNVNRGFALPLDISFPIPGPLPLAGTFHQSVLVHTMFTAKSAVLAASGEYALQGRIAAGIVDGKLDATAPASIEGTKHLANGLSGSSLGVNGLVLGYSGKLIVGLGAFSFVVGPYVSTNITGGVTRGSDLQVGLVGYTCRSATTEMWLDYGIGFAVPAWTVKVLNAFIGIFHAKPVDSSYGTRLGTRPIYQRNEAIPPSCAAQPS